MNHQQQAQVNRKEQMTRAILGKPTETYLPRVNEDEFPGVSIAIPSCIKDIEDGLNKLAEAQNMLLHHLEYCLNPRPATMEIPEPPRPSNLTMSPMAEQLNSIRKQVIGRIVDIELILKLLPF